MRRLLLATNNEGKLAELRALLNGLGLELVSPSEIGLELKVVETGQTYAENATLKAQEFARASGLAALADDSGLEVEALGGAPGVFSSRYAGPDAGDPERNSLLLKYLENVPPERRAARFVCAIAIATPAGRTWLAEGQCHGYISNEPRGEHGFGYDPVFYLPNRRRTMAELPPSIKHRISHRALAARRARAILQRLIREIDP